MINPKMSDADKQILRQIIGEEGYKRLDSLKNIMVTYWPED
jgi:hypothetical protein